MPDDKEKTMKLTREERDALPPSSLIKIGDDVRKRLTGWLTGELSKMDRRRQETARDLDRWEKVLRGKSPRPSFRPGMSNVSVPLTMSADTAIRARLNLGTLRQRPFVTIGAAGERKRVTSTGEVNLADTGKKLARFVESQVFATRGLNGKRALRTSIASAVRAGTGGWVVQDNPPMWVNVAPAPGGDGKPQRVLRRGGVRWVPIKFRDMLYYDGYGADPDGVNEMPFVGYRVRKTWGDIKAWEAHGYYYPGTADRVNEVIAREDRADPSTTPAALRNHNVDELYMDYDVDEDGRLESVVVDWHHDAHYVMRVSWNQFGRRPIVAHQLDLNADPDEFQGQGVPAKLDGVQEEVDDVHNIGIEGGKRAAASGLVVKKDSSAEAELGEDEALVPGFMVAADDPKEDVVRVELGNPEAITAVAILEERVWNYIPRLLGIDPTSIGNVQAAKRVPGGLGMSIKREGRLVSEDSLASLGAAIEEAIYLTFSAWRRRVPLRELVDVLGEAAAATLTEVVFAKSDREFRDTFKITVNASDPSESREAAQTKLFALNQFLMGFYQQVLAGLGPMSDPKVPPQAKAIIVAVIEKMLNAVHLLLSTIDEVPDPEEVLLTMQEMQEVLRGVQASVVQGGAGAIPPTAPAR